MSVLTLEAKLERVDSTTPWGFRMQGGKDFSSPVTIARVTPGSLAAKCGLQQGDVILKIGSKLSETLKHKDAQDAILSYGNKLDLLLQRIREKKKLQNGIGGGAPTYDRFTTPTISSYQSPAAAPSGGSGGSNYNTAPKPFGASQPTPAPYKPATDNLAQQTQNLNLNQAPSYSKYSDYDDKPGGASHQSRSFKFLADTLDSGQEPPAALRPTVDLRRSPSPNTQGGGVKTQFNSPASLYSTSNLQKQQNLVRPEDASSGAVGDTEEDVKYDAQGKRLYRPSETYKLIQEQENEPEKQDKPADVKQTRTIKVLEKQLGGQNGIEPPSIPQNLQKGGEAVVYYPSQTYQLVLQQEHPTYRAELKMHVPEQSQSFVQLERSLQGEQPQAPAPAPARAPPAPKPGVWTPGAPSTGSGPAAPAAKPFVPSVAPAPRQAPPKPSGVGAVRGKIGDAVMKTDMLAVGRTPVCHSCGKDIRGPFVLAMGKTWCPDHFTCANPKCGVKLIDIGFVEESGFLYCEKDYELYFAPHCAKCEAAIVGECVNALNKQYHPSCFLCHQCNQPIGGNQFHLEDGHAYCENDWRQMFQTMCTSCNFPIEPGDKWVEALNSNFHSECFNCSTCQVNLEGQAFFAKAGKPYCKKHAR